MCRHSVIGTLCEDRRHRVRGETISQATLRSSLRSAGLGDKQIEGMAGMSAVTREDFVAEDKRSILTTTPTTLAAWAYVHLRPALVSPPR
jgi:hypothetical protein